MLFFCEEYKTLEKEAQGACPNHAHQFEQSAAKQELHTSAAEDRKNHQVGATSPTPALMSTKKEITSEQHAQIGPRNLLPRLLAAAPSTPYATDATPSYPGNSTTPPFPSSADMAYIFPDLYPLPSSTAFSTLATLVNGPNNPHPQYPGPQPPHQRPFGCPNAVEQPAPGAITTPIPSVPRRRSKAEGAKEAVIVAYNPATGVFERPGRTGRKKSASGTGEEMGL